MSVTSQRLVNSRHIPGPRLLCSMAQLLDQMTYLFQDLVSCFISHFSDGEEERSLLISFNLSNVNVIQIHM